MSPKSTSSDSRLVDFQSENKEDEESEKVNDD